MVSRFVGWTFLDNLFWSLISGPAGHPTVGFCRPQWGPAQRSVSRPVVSASTRRVFDSIGGPRSCSRRSRGWLPRRSGAEALRGPAPGTELGTQERIPQRNDRPAERFGTLNDAVLEASFPERLITGGFMNNLRSSS